MYQLSSFFIIVPLVKIYCVLIQVFFDVSWKFSGQRAFVCFDTNSRLAIILFVWYNTVLGYILGGEVLKALLNYLY